MASETIYLTLDTTPGGASVSVGVPYDEVMVLDRKGFAKLYRRTVYGAKRSEALAWADRQIAKRAAAAAESVA